MPIMFNDLMHLSPEEIANSKVEFNIRAGKKGEYFIERWLRHNNDEIIDGTCFDCSYWKWEKPGQIVFSFLRVADDKWIFVSAARIIEVRNGEVVKVEIVSECKKYFGRLLVRYKKPSWNYVYNLSSQINNMIVEGIADSFECFC